MLRRTVRLARVGALVGAEAATVAVLHGLARIDGLRGPGGDPAAWLRTSSPEEVVAGTLRLLAVGCAWWLLASTVVYAVALVAGRAALARTLCRVVLPSVRRRVERALAVSIVASATLGSGVAGIAAAGEPVPEPSVEVRDGRAVEALPPPGPPAAPTAPLPAPVPPPAPAEVAPAVHVVSAGESLWTIAAARTVPGGDVGRYWMRVVDANRATLRSGNPNLIYPGEAVELP
jgi:nucleoid-associated protein YgaU